MQSSKKYSYATMFLYVNYYIFVTVKTKVITKYDCYYFFF